MLIGAALTLVAAIIVGALISLTAGVYVGAVALVLFLLSPELWASIFRAKERGRIKKEAETDGRAVSSRPSGVSQ